VVVAVAAVAAVAADAAFARYFVPTIGSVPISEGSMRYFFAISF
jgi:hypothetical protein